MTNRTIFVSDIHISTDESMQRHSRGYPYAWLSKREANRFARFLTNLPKMECTELVLLGDIFEFTNYPIDVVPPSFQELAENKLAGSILELIGDLPASIDVLYLNGNHDMHVTEEDLSSVAGGRIQMIDLYEQDGIIGMHGHEQAFFNGPDPTGEPYNLGYFVSRVSATMKRDTGRDLNRLKAILHNPKEVLSLNKNTLGRVVFDVCLDEADIAYDAVIRMPDGDRTAASVMEDYENLYLHWRDADGLCSPSAAVYADWGDPWRAIYNQVDYTVLICGHSHERAFRAFGNYAAYMNAGSWVDSSPSFAVVTRDDGNRLDASLCRWSNSNKVAKINSALITP